jgi:hypothetical protein
MKGPATLVVVLALALAASAGAATAGAASDRPTVGATVEFIPRLWRNCTNYNKRYPHGVGRRLARDKTSGTPVTTFSAAHCSTAARCATTAGLTATRTGSPARRSDRRPAVSRSSGPAGVPVPALATTPTRREQREDRSKE